MILYINENIEDEVRYIDTTVSQRNDTVHKKHWEDVFHNQDPIKNDEVIRVYHGCDLKTAVTFAKEGLSGKQSHPRKFSYEMGMNPIGLFVSTSFDVVKQFANSFGGGKNSNASVIIEFSAKASDLDTPVWNGQNTYFGQYSNPMPFADKEARNSQKMHYNDIAANDEYDYIRNSDNKALAYNIFKNSEHQALFLGDLNPNMIKRFWVKPMQKEDYYWIQSQEEFCPMTRKEFLKKYGNETFYNGRDFNGNESYYPINSNKLYLPNEDFGGIEDMAKRQEKRRENTPWVKKEKAEGRYDYDKEIKDTIDYINQELEIEDYDLFKEILWPKQLIQLLGKEKYEKYFDRYGIVSQNESKKPKTIYITEEKLALLEGKDRKQQARKKTKNVISQYFNNSPMLDEPNEHTNGMSLIDFLEQECMHDFFHTYERADAKRHFVCLEPMVMNIILHAGWQQDRPDDGVIARLESILNYIEELYNQQQIEPQSIPLDSTINDLEQQFGSAIDEREAAAQAERATKEYTPNSNYTILDDVDYEKAHEIGNYSYSGLKLCYTQSENTWKNSFHGDRNKVYVALSNGWEDIPQDHGESLLEQYLDANAYDEYGLSMIFIFVDPDGELAYSNTRWNHQANYGKGRSVDHAFTKDDLSNLLGYNFDTRFVGYTDEELAEKGIKHVGFKKIPKLLAQGVDPNEIFDDIDYDGYGKFRIVTLNDKENLLNENNELVSPNLWFNVVARIREGFSRVNINGKHNFLNITDGSLLLNEWVDGAGFFSNGVARVSIRGKGCNFVNKEGKVIFPDWYNMIGEFYNGVAVVRKDEDMRSDDGGFIGHFNFISQEGKLLSDQWFDYAANFWSKYARVRIGKEWNLMSCDGQLLSPNIWFNDIMQMIGGDGNPFYRVNQKGKGYNVLNVQGKLLSEDMWFDFVGSFFDEGYVKVEKSYGEVLKSNFLSEYGGLLSDQWFSSAGEFHDGIVTISFDNKKYNFMNSIGEIISPNLWFDDVYSFHEEWAAVRLNGKCNFINSGGKFISNQWFDAIYGEVHDGVACIGKRKKTNQVGTFEQFYNFINTNGQLLSPNIWFDYVDDFEYGYASVRIPNKGWGFLKKDGTLVCNGEVITQAFIEQPSVTESKAYPLNEYNIIDDNDDEVVINIDSYKMHNEDEDDDYFTVPQIKHKGEYYLDDDEEATPFVVLDNGQILYGRNGTLHDHNYNIIKAFKYIVAYGRIFFTEEEDIIIVLSSKGEELESYVSNPVKIVNEICSEKGFDKDKVYYHVDSYSNSIDELHKLTKGEDNGLESRYQELSKRRGDELEAKWRAEHFQESVQRKHVLKENASSILYHFTDFDTFKKIAETDDFHLSKTNAYSEANNDVDRNNVNNEINGEYPYYISFTRSPNPNQGFSQWYMPNANMSSFSENDFSYKGIVRIEFDGDKLNQNFKSKPIDFYTHKFQNMDNKDKKNHEELDKIHFPSTNEMGNVSSKEVQLNTPNQFDNKQTESNPNPFFVQNEDRLFSTKEWIDNVSQYITRVDIKIYDKYEQECMQEVFNLAYRTILGREGKIHLYNNFEGLNRIKKGSDLRIDGDIEGDSTSFHSLGESRHSTTIHITESKLALLEGKDRKQQARKKTKNVIRQYFNNSPMLDEPNEETQGLPLIDFLEQECMHDFFHTYERADAKKHFVCLEPMVMNIILHAGWQQDRPDDGVIARLESILNYIEELYNQQQIEPQSIPLDSTINDLEREFGSVIDEREAAAQAERATKEYTPNGNYTIIDDVDYEKAHEIGNYSYSGLKLCYTQSESTWTDSFHGDRNKVYVALSNSWKDVLEKHGESLLEQYPNANAYDEYGLSMIFIFVDPDGGLAYSNTRWNHEADYGQGRSVDHAFTKDDLSDLLGYNFDRRFVGYTEEELKAKGIKYTSCKKVLKLLAQGVDPNEIFESISGIESEGFRGVKLNDKYNYLSTDNRLLSPNQWFDWAHTFKHNCGEICIDGKWNLINADGQILFPNLWFDSIDDFRDDLGIRKVYIEDKGSNLINTEGQLISPNLWFKKISRTYQDDEFIAVVRNRDVKVNLMKANGELLSDMWFDNINGCCHGNEFYVVELNEEQNIINREGQLISNEWFNSCSKFSEGLAIVNRIGVNDEIEYNWINTKGEIFSSQWFDYVGAFKNGHACVSINNKDNIIDKNRQLFSKQWCDWIHYIGENFAACVLERAAPEEDRDEEWHILDSNGQILYPNIIFRHISDFKNGFAIVSNREGTNFLNTKGQLILKDFVHWGIDSFNEFGISIVSKYYGKRTFNAINGEGQLLSPDTWFDYIETMSNGSMIVQIITSRGEYSDKTITNILTVDGRFLLPHYIDAYVKYFSDLGIYSITLKDKYPYRYNFVDENGQLLSPNMWFAEIIASDAEKKCIYAKGTDNNKYTLFLDGRLVPMQEPSMAESRKRKKKVYIPENKLLLLTKLLQK